MHEVALIENMIDQLAQQLTAEQLNNLSAVHLQIGCRSGVDVSAMRFAFNATRGKHPHLAEKAEINIEVQQAKMKCRNCSHEWLDSDRLPTCPICSNVHCEAEGGTDLMITHVEVA